MFLPLPRAFTFPASLEPACSKTMLFNRNGILFAQNTDLLGVYNIAEENSKRKVAGRIFAARRLTIFRRALRAFGGYRYSPAKQQCG
jgi:hypothetical protein